MGINHFQIISLERFPFVDEHDSIEFKAGVNVIVGELNTGKTKWLQMIDYLLGDSGKPELAFDEELAEKYDSIVANVKIAGESYEIKRQWKEPGKKTKTFINDEPYSVKEFSQFILDTLGIPSISVPTGNPYSDRTWPQLSFREMFRHMYKQENLWSDIAQKQNEVIRSAVILLFLNKAKELYSEEYSKLVSKDKLRDKVEARKDVFIDVLQDVAVDVVRDPSMSVAITEDSLSISKESICREMHELEISKADLIEQTEATGTMVQDDTAYEQIRIKLQLLLNEQGQLEGEKGESIKRRAELQVYQVTLFEELSRFDRATIAASVFSDLRVTHCPSCDQTLKIHRHPSPACNVCGQNILNEESIESSQKRVDFEKDQISDELNELHGLIAALSKNIDSIDNKILDLQGLIKTEQMRLRAVENLSIRGLPPEISLIDIQLGKLSEKLEQIGRIEQTLRVKDKYNEEIGLLDKEISILNETVAAKKPDVNFSALSDVIADKMNTYINAVNVDNLSTWKTGRVSVKLRRDDFKIMLNGQPWTVKAGGTKNYVIQLAYHYALFSLSKDSSHNYPGFLIVDFPPHFSDAKALKGSENYLLEPFIKLCKRKGMESSQVIIAGRSFKNLEGVHFIRF